METCWTSISQAKIYYILWFLGPLRFLVTYIALVGQLSSGIGIYFSVFVYLKFQHDLKISAEIRKNKVKNTIKDDENY